MSSDSHCLAALAAAGDVLLDGYERLRSHALARRQSCGATFGLAIFVRDGMRAWMEACWESTPAVEIPPAHPRVATPSLPVSVQAEPTRMLASIVLSHGEQDRRP